MTAAAIIELIKGFFEFPGELLQLARFLRKTPAEQRGELMAEIEKTAHNFQSTGRPTWDE